MSRSFIRSSVLAFAGIALLSGCGPSAAARESAAPAPVEFYFYLNSDQDILGSRADGEIDGQGEILFDELRALAPAANFGLHLYLDRGMPLKPGDSIDSETYDRCADASAESAKLGETDSTDPKHLSALLDKKCYPDAKRFVVLWGHGDGFRVQNDFDYDPGDRAFHISTLLSAIPDGFAEAILFDSCAMASLEIASLVEKKAKWMIASQYELPNIGIQYAGLTSALGRDRESTSLLRSLRDASEAAFREIDFNAPLVILDLTKLASVRKAFAEAWEASAPKRLADYPAYRASVLRAHDGDLYFLFAGHAPESKKVLATALVDGRGSLHFALPLTPLDRDADLDAVANAVPEVFRTWSENFPNWAAYARFRSSTPPTQGVLL